MDYDQTAKFLKALGHPTRLLIVSKLARKEMCVCKINELVDVDQSTISKHLSQLKGEGIINSEKRGSFMFYSLKDKRVLSLLKVL
ncbi:MAG: winged helix-turn-helix transcriptional regulator [Bacteriovoracaceae bacterium]|nr:winged helix-turn-helix transcriptional regulator [Bacteriovoracaceae bacterium]